MTHLLFKCIEKVSEPFKGVRVRTNPKEVDLGDFHVSIGCLVSVPLSETGIIHSIQNAARSC